MLSALRHETQNGISKPFQRRINRHFYFLIVSGFSVRIAFVYHLICLAAMGVFWLAENMRWGPPIGCEHDSASFPRFLWMACRMSLNPPPILPSFRLWSVYLPASTFVKWMYTCGGSEDCICRECVRVYVCHQIKGWGLGCFSLRDKVFPPSCLHPTSLRSVHYT